MELPKIIQFDKYADVHYPFGNNWNSAYIEQIAKCIYDIFKYDIKHHTSITLVARGSSGAMIAGAVLNELHRSISDYQLYLMIVRIENDDFSHSYSLHGLSELTNTKIIVVDDFIASGKTIREILKSLDDYLGNEKKNNYDMLCISNQISEFILRQRLKETSFSLRDVYSRFDYIVCNPVIDEVQL